MARIQELTLVRGNRGLLVLAVLAGLVAAILVFAVLANSGGGNSGSTTPAGKSAAVVAKKNIAAGASIGADMVEVKLVPDDLLIAGALADVKLVVGEAARFPIAQGEQVTPSKLGAAVQGQGLGGVVPNGKRAVGVEVKEVTAAGGLLLAGDRVDMYAMFSGRNAGDPNVVYRVIQNVEVLSVGQKAQKAVPASDAGAGADPLHTSGQVPDDLKTDPGASTLTVAVEPQYVPLLVCVQEAHDVAKVWLALRAFGEPEPPADKIVTIPPACSFP